MFWPILKSINAYILLSCQRVIRPCTSKTTMYYGCIMLKSLEISVKLFWPVNSQKPDNRALKHIKCIVWITPPPPSRWQKDLQWDCWSPNTCQNTKQIIPYILKTFLSINFCYTSIICLALEYGYVGFHYLEGPFRVLKRLNSTPVRG